MFFDEMEPKQQKEIVVYFSNNKNIILKEILKGSDDYDVNWMMVVLKLKNKNPLSILKPIDEVIKIYGSGNVEISPRGSLKIGKVTMQRKGGNRGRETAKMLQFKINPAILFEF